MVMRDVVVAGLRFLHPRPPRSVHARRFRGRLPVHPRHRHLKRHLDSGDGAVIGIVDVQRGEATFVSMNALRKSSPDCCQKIVSRGFPHKGSLDNLRGLAIDRDGREADVQLGQILLEHRWKGNIRIQPGAVRIPTGQYYGTAVWGSDPTLVAIEGRHVVPTG